jgi:hypothetical protein
MRRLFGSWGLLARLNGRGTANGTGAWTAGEASASWKLDATMAGPTSGTGPGMADGAPAS